MARVVCWLTNELSIEFKVIGLFGLFVILFQEVTFYVDSIRFWI